MWTVDFPISLGSGNTGLASTLKFALQSSTGTIHATLRDLTHATVGASLTEQGSGLYQFQYTAVPDAYAGSIVFYTGTVGAGTDFSGVTVLGALGFGYADEVAAKSGTSGGLPTVDANNNVHGVQQPVQTRKVNG